jgi:hypothetical protein
MTAYIMIIRPGAPVVRRVLVTINGKRIVAPVIYKTKKELDK